MIKDYLKSFLTDYQRVIVAKLLMGCCFVGGFFIVILVLATILVITYPAYVWCVLGGFIFLWLLSFLMLYGYLRIIKAESRARTLQLRSAEHYVSVLVSAIVTVLECRKKSRKK